MAKKKRLKISKKVRNSYILAAALLACAYLFYGYFRAQENVRFLGQIEPSLNESREIWTSKTFASKMGTDLGKDDAFYRKMSEISARALEATKGAKDTKDTKALKKDIEDYFIISKSIADNSLRISESFKLYGKINADLGQVSASPANPVGDLEKWRGLIDADIAALKKEPTPAFKKSQEETIAALSSLSKNLDILEKSIKAKDANGIKKAAAAIEDSEFNVAAPSYGAVLADIITDERFKRFQVLDERIQSKIAKVKKKRIILY